MLIQNAIIIDGTGKKNYVADIRTRRDKIVDIGKLSPRSKEPTINARGAFVTPGFVDILNHSDAYLTLFSNPAQESLLQQGITSILMGNCGSSLAPLADGNFINSLQKWGDVTKVNVNWLSMKEYLAELKKHSFGPNVATLVGHSTVRRSIVEDQPRNLTQEELELLSHLIGEGIRDGAFGVSTGLAYTHARNASLKEIETVMRIAKKENSLYATHLRNESGGFIESFRETLEMAHDIGVNLEFSHLKVTGKQFWNQFSEALSELNPRTRNINFDIYPYRTTASVLYTFLPTWVSEGGKKSLLANILNLKIRARLIQEMHDDPHSYKNMIVAMGGLNKVFFGKSIAQIAINQNTSVEETVLNMISISSNRIIVFTETISEENIIRAMRHGRSFVTSAGVGYNVHDDVRGEFIHPRYFGAIPKFLSHYVRNQKFMSWERAIYKVTLGPAIKIGLKKRGRIEKGYYADLVIFDPHTIQDTATFTSPYQYPLGIHYVIVNGEISIAEGKFTGKMMGKVLKKKK